MNLVSYLTRVNHVSGLAYVNCMQSVSYGDCHYPASQLTLAVVVSKRGSVHVCFADAEPFRCNITFGN